MIILSFDPASFKNLGWSVLNTDTNTLSSGTIVFNDVGKDNPSAVLYPVWLIADGYIESYCPKKLIIEKTSSFSGGFVTGQVSMVSGVILAAAGRHSIPVEFVYPTHVKKIITGNGKATKALMKKAIEARLKNYTVIGKPDSDHAFDAIANIFSYLDENILDV